MHPYAAEPRERITIVLVFILAGLSILLSYLLKIALEQADFPKQLLDQYPLLFNPPSAFIICAVLYKLFDKYLWKILPYLGVNFPNLNSSWLVEINPSNVPDVTGLTGELRIQQSWSKISIALDTNVSFSWSLTAAITFPTPDKILLTNQYEVLPKESAPAGVQRHVGTNQLVIKRDKTKINILSGEYYTERNRASYGTISFKEERK